MLKDTYDKKLPYDMRNNPQAGGYKGVGERGKTGERPGTYTVTKARKPMKAPKKI